MIASDKGRRDTVRWLLEKSNAPRFIDGALRAFGLAWTRLTSAGIALFCTFMQLTGTLTTWAAIGLGLVGLALLATVAGILSWYQDRYRYIRGLEDRMDVVRASILRTAGINSEAPAEFYRYKMLQVRWSQQRGTLELLIDRPGGAGLVRGSKLALFFTATDDFYGTVTVDDVADDHAVAVPSDRAKPTFWDELERQGDKNPVPPPGFHLEPSIPDWLANAKRK